jgi:hypothetical protein
MVRKEKLEVREILAVRNTTNADSDDYIKSDGNIEKHDLYQVAEGWYKKDNDSKERNIARENIRNVEEHWMIHGIEDLNIIGINSTNTIRHDLLNAIGEFKPDFIITSSTYLDIKDIDIYYSAYVPEKVSFLGVRDPKIAEFVISEDIHVTDDYIREKDGRQWVEMKEWVCIEIHEPDAFVKVCR